MNRTFIIGSIVTVLVVIMLFLEEASGFLRQYLLFFIIGMLIIAAVIWKLGDGKTALLTMAVGLILPYSTLVGIIAIYVLFYYATGFRSYEQEKLLQALVLEQHGLKADRITVLSSSPTQYDLCKHSVSGNAVDVKFVCDGRYYKGIYDTDHKKIVLREEILAPVYGNNRVPIWGEISEIYDDGTPQQIMYYDSIEWVSRIDYFDKRGMRTIESWRRIHDHIEFWNPAKKAWERVHDVPRFEET